MFNKLLSNLPFNPSLINQVSFYAKRLKQESSIRRLGFILVSLTMFLQLFAVLSPAQPSLAASTNDLKAGGFSSKSQIVAYCLTNAEYRAILAHFAIGCSNLQENSQVTNVRSDAIKNGQPLYSMGRNPQGAINSITGRATNESKVTVAGLSQPFYMRLLSSWDKRVPSTYQALSVGNAFGIQFYILYTCGNIVEFGPPPKPVTPKPVPKPVPKPKPTPKPTPKPKPKPVPTPTKPCAASTDINDVTSCIKLSKRASNLTQNLAHANNTTAKPGDTIIYTLLTQNTSVKVAAKDYVITENMQDVLDYANIINLGGASQNDHGILTWPATTIAAGKTVTEQVTVKVKDPVPKTPQPCNPAVVDPCPLTGSFDLTMTNVYGNTIEIKVKPPVAKTVEITTTKTLTNTGPGTSLIIGFSLTAMVGYFFARSRLMAKELDLVRVEYTSGGF